MGNILDLNITNLDEGAFRDHLGDGNQYIVAGILIRLGFEVSISSIGRLPYDMIVRAYKQPGELGSIIRVQTRTVHKRSIHFGGGGRGGVNRKYIPGIKEYKFTEEHNDLIIGIEKELNFYLIPTSYLKHWGNSKSVSLLSPLKNNWDILLNWNDKFLEDLWNEHFSD